AHGAEVPSALDAGRGADEAPLRVLPGPAVVAELSDEALAMPRTRAAAVRAVAAAVADGILDLDGGAPGDDVRRALLALPGIGPWTAEYVAMRALGDPDAFPATDLGLRRGAARIGIPDGARALAARAATWSPWRSYAAQHLWTVTVPRSAPTFPSAAPSPSEGPR
ncbi:MAG: DNA-3-methyladenine glycosylase, partial [Solirubrobacteraceae bacterium]